jgi:hypothetical protein
MGKTVSVTSCPDEVLLITSEKPVTRIQKESCF